MPLTLPLVSYYIMEVEEEHIEHILLHSVAAAAAVVLSKSLIALIFITAAMQT